MVTELTLTVGAVPAEIVIVAFADVQPFAVVLTV